MTETIEIRPYRDGDEEGILELFNRVFSEDDPAFVPRDRATWRWQFRGNPLGHHTWVAADGDRVVGTYTAIPGTWLLRGEPFVGSQAVDSCVAKEHRRSLKREGLFLRLARAWFDDWGRPERDRIVYGFPNPQAFRIGTRLLDYRPVHTPVRMLVRDFAFDWIEYLGPMGANAVEVREVRSFDPQVDELFARTTGTHPLVQRRDRAWLEWRYRACPSVKYHVLEARDWGTQELRGVLVLRTRWRDRPVSPLVDWIVDGRDREAVAGLAQRAASMADAEGRRRIETWVPPWSDLAATLQEIGFAWDETRFNLCIRIFGPDFDPEWARDHWYFTMGDSDVY